jgi:O-succinylbenzoate synthase
MRLRFQFRRYRLPFRTVVRTAHGPWPEREGLCVRIQDVSEAGSGRVGFGEAAPIPWFGTETIDEDEAAAAAIAEWIERPILEEIPARCACLRHAVNSALAELRGDSADSGNAHLGVAALLPAGPGALTVIASRAELGFRVFKWKVGVGDLGDELALFDDVCAALPPGGKLRLDANGAWDRRAAERWLERCAERPVEFVEQPCFAGPSESVRTRARGDDTLLGLAEDFPTPLALDESLVCEEDLERWLGAGWRGVFVVKPALFADPRAALDRLQQAKAEVVFSSALETALGARTALRLAFQWPGTPRALGFGVWPLFSDSRFDGGYAAPFVHRADVDRIDAEAIWTALS